MWQCLAVLVPCLQGMDSEQSQVCSPPGSHGGAQPHADLFAHSDHQLAATTPRDRTLPPPSPATRSTSPTLTDDMWNIAGHEGPGCTRT